MHRKAAQMKIKSMALAVMLSATCGQIFANNTLGVAVLLSATDDQASEKSNLITKNCHEIGKISKSIIQGRVSGQPKSMMLEKAKQMTSNANSPVRGDRAFATVLNQVINNAYGYQLPQTRDAGLIGKHVSHFASTQEKTCIQYLQANTR